MSHTSTVQLPGCVSYRSTFPGADSPWRLRVSHSGQKYRTIVLPSRTRLKIELEIDIDRSKRWWIWLAMNSSVLHRPITFPTCLLLPGVKLGTWQGPVRSMVPSGSFALRLVFRFAKPLNVRCSGEFEISATPDPKLDLFLSLFLNPAKPRVAGLLQLAPNGRNHPANHNGGLGSQSCPATP